MTGARRKFIARFMSWRQVFFLGAEEQQNELAGGND